MMSVNLERTTAIIWAHCISAVIRKAHSAASANAAMIELMD